MQALESYLSGRWSRGEGVETTLTDPVTGEALATASARGLDLAGALAFARREGQGALRGMGYAARAKLVGAVADVLVANRAKYEAIAIANSGNTKADAAIDIDGGIGTLKYYARLAAGLGEARALLDEKPVRLAKAENYQAIHLMVPRRGTAVHINAFNFPSWGLWEKAAVALIAGDSGLEIFRRLIPQAAARLRPDGLLLLEVGMGQADPVAGLACEAGLRVEEIVRDLQGIPRCVAARKLDL